MTSILLESKDQLLINPSFTFFPLLEGNLPQLRYVFSLLLFNLWTQTKRSIDQAEQATCMGKAWFLEIRGSIRLAQSQNLRSISDRSPSLVFGRFCFLESWTSAAADEIQTKNKKYDTQRKHKFLPQRKTKWPWLEYDEEKGVKFCETCHKKYPLLADKS